MATPRKAPSRLTVVGVAVGLVAAVAGCGRPQALEKSNPARSVVASELSATASPSSTEVPRTSSSAPAPPATDPVGLIGLWRPAAGTSLGTGVTLRFDEDSVSLWRRCGDAWGSWRAEASGVFVAAGSGHTTRCYRTGPQDLEWLERIAAFRIEGETPVLIDARGKIIARLRRGTVPKAPPDIAPGQAARPQVTAEVQADLAPAVEVPPSVVAAGARRLVGRWVSTEHDNPGAFLQFQRGGQWRGSDGCNRFGGRWASGAGGSLVTVPEGVSAPVGCEPPFGPFATEPATDGSQHVPVAEWLRDTARAGFKGDELVLFHRRGREVARLRSAS